MKITSTIVSKAVMLLPLFSLLTVILIAGIILWPENPKTDNAKTSITNIVKNLPTPSATPTLPPLPSTYIIPQKLHAFQTFNNCGPVTLSMALSYWGINIAQAELGRKLRPYQIPGGDNDDKSTTLEEVANEAENLGLNAYLRPNGDIEKLKQFVANDIPVVARTWLHVNEDIGHYRLIRGYTENQIFQDDSLEGQNLYFSNEDFLTMWKPFNNEYLIIVNDSKKEIAERILGEDLDEKVAWQNALKETEENLKQNPEDTNLIFAMSRIHYHLGNYEQSVEYFNKVENRLSFRTLWYQIEPIEAIYETGDYDRLFSLTERILNNQNRAFSELYYLRGKAYQNQGNIDAARQEFEKAVFYNKNNAKFKEALAAVAV